MIFAFNFFSQEKEDESIKIGGFSIDYLKPQKYEIGPIRVEGADNYDHQAIKLIAGLRQGG